MVHDNICCLAGRFNERLVLSLASNPHCLLMDDELNVLPTSTLIRHITPLPTGELQTDSLVLTAYRCPAYWLSAVVGLVGFVGCPTNPSPTTADVHVAGGCTTLVRYMNRLSAVAYRVLCVPCLL